MKRKLFVGLFLAFIVSISSWSALGEMTAPMGDTAANTELIEANVSDIADNTSDIALKADKNLGNINAAGTNVIENIAGTAGSYVSITNGTQVGSVRLEALDASTNFVSRVITNNVGGYTDGLVLITKVFHGTTNTFYDLTD